MAADIRRLVLFSIALSWSASVFAETADELAQRNYQHNRVLDSTADLTMTLANKAGDQRVRKLRSTTKLKADGIDNMRLLTFSYPADVKGTTTLLVEQTGRDDDMWIYLPALKKVRRLVAQNKRDSFVGSDLSFGDILGHKPQDWTFKKVGEEMLDGVATAVIEATPKNSEVARNTGYSLRKLWLAADTAVALRTDYFDEAGQALKTVTVSDVRAVDGAPGKTQFMRIEASNQQSGSRTTMSFDGYKASVGISADVFSPLALEP
ncbi:MAG: exporters of the superfamily-like protein [Hydrocarboniphaga sp.]|uniref:outer membrane lipoprotein-sorting protein n=1 Tax=Hydrocarboniphaga sp. TaxID=2033016 RepID=UPI00260E24A1|nr:outer membrane lipoprotein-sorting protein [Hydrocarboniphaga sp.]MDB5967917.1 exporters of the superfamily-like protein [Hydrocarboniphaga sp.]